MLRVVIVLVVIGALVYALVDCLRADARDLRLLPKPAWLIVVLVPVAGPLFYLLAGRPAGGIEEPLVRPPAPDDDPEFLRRLAEEQRRRKADEERRRRRTERENEREKQEDNGGPAAPSGQTPE